MTSNASNSSHRDNRSSSFAPSEGAADNIRAHAESISQMLEAASHSNALQGNSQDSSRLGVQGNADAGVDPSLLLRPFRLKYELEAPSS
jgi:hypothetical protein